MSSPVMLGGPRPAVAGCGPRYAFTSFLSTVCRMPPLR